MTSLHGLKKYWLAITMATLVAVMAIWLGSKQQSAPELSPGAHPGDFSGFTACDFDGAAVRESSLAECGTLVVAENRDNSTGRLLALPIVRLPAEGSAPLEPIFFLTGGPGGSNLGYQFETPRLYESHDIVLMGYRGVDDAMPLDCPEWAENIVLAKPLADSTRPALANAASRCALRLQEQGIDLSRYTMFDVIEDLEALRRVLGYERINLHTSSYGTRLAQYYARIHPTSIKRSALFGLNPPGHFRWFPEVTNRLLGEYSARCAQDSYCRSRTDDLAATVHEVLSARDKSWLGLSIDGDKLRLITFFMLMSRSSSVAAFDALIAAEHGDMGGIYLLAKAYDLVMPYVSVWGDMWSKAGGDLEHCANDEKLQEFIAYTQASTHSLGSPLDLLLSTACGSWPLVPYDPVFTRAVLDPTESLLVNGNLDISTPLVFAETELLPFLPNGELLILTDFGHEEWKSTQQDALDHLLTVFFRSGEVDASLYRHETVTFEMPMGMSFLAKTALAVVTILFLCLALGITLFIRKWTKKRIVDNQQREMVG